MNCVNHLETAATAFCRTCGKALCPECQVSAFGTVVCAEHTPAQAASDPRPYVPPMSSAQSEWGAQPPPPVSDVSPGLAFVLGLIPGVGAIYNAQYAKGLIHVLIIGLLISIMNSNAAGGLEPMFGILIPIFWIYMAFEAYHTAKKRQMRLPVDEFSSIVPLRGGGGFPAGPVILIAAGVVFLLLNLDVIRLYQVVRYWPVFLIVLGVYMLYGRIRQSEDSARAQREANNER